MVPGLNAKKLSIVPGLNAKFLAFKPGTTPRKEKNEKI